MFFRILISYVDARCRHPFHSFDCHRRPACTAGRPPFRRHRISAKHLPAYLEEMGFRFNRRKRSDLFFDTLRHMVTAPGLTFEKLTT